jgi:hypothetical protein
VAIYLLPRIGRGSFYARSSTGFQHSVVVVSNRYFQEFDSRPVAFTELHLKLHKFLLFTCDMDSIDVLSR